MKTFYEECVEEVARESVRNGATNIQFEDVDLLVVEKAKLLTATRGGSYRFPKESQNGTGPKKSDD